MINEEASLPSPSAEAMLVKHPKGVGSKRGRTRAHLVNTAVGVFAAKGVANASVLDVTKAAGVSNGTFYVHFSSKEGLVAEVSSTLSSIIFDELGELLKGITSAPLRAALATQWIIGRVVAAPSLGRLLSQGLSEDGAFQDQALQRVRTDFPVAQWATEFSIADAEAGIRIILGVVATCLRLALSGSALREMQMMASETTLRIMGLSVAESRAISLGARELLPPG